MDPGLGFLPLPLLVCRMEWLWTLCAKTFMTIWNAFDVCLPPMSPR